MPSKVPTKSVAERALEAETRASQWLADGNQAREMAARSKQSAAFRRRNFG